MDGNTFTPTDKPCPACAKRTLEFEELVEKGILLGGRDDRTPLGYTCLNPECGGRFSTSEVPNFSPPAS